MICLHRKLIARRLHKLSEDGIKYNRKAITVDKYNCLIAIYCLKCGKVMDVEVESAEAFDKLTLEEEKKERKEILLAQMCEADRKLFNNDN